ncbi:DNA alkylation repair protein [Sulfitobacter pacificus]|uniref:DNA alkylation repair protein n=1 Tax=Sulfitobacter pacificus TaxID=1499314 RepID=A0ABQ5VIZ2_9RHOB|nr:DNA alkylation repair protein [Sulfitobacter pacificus]GLQ26996.1 DNA alkylation repair protein [Sulfitobacter pacificus]
MHEPYLEQLTALADQARAVEMRKYHKVDRTYLGLSNPQIDALTKEWRAELETDARVALSDALWQTDVYEARVAAAKLLTQARIRPDDTAAWELIASWTPDFDSWAIADHACMAGQKRLVADPARLDHVETWITSDHMWTRRAAFVSTLPWTKQNHPKPAEIEARDRILGWAATLTTDHRWFIQKAIGWWLRELSKHDANRTTGFIDAHGDKMKPFAVKEALRFLKKSA